jgi:hypothetical protein
VEKDGTVSKSKVTSASFAFDRHRTSCVERQIGRVRFPPRTAAAEGSYRYRFTFIL